jgi:hypothetical protein
MAGTGAQNSNPTEPVELAEPVTIDGTVDVGNPCSDIEQVLLTDEGTDPDTDFLRTYEYDCDGDIVGFTDTLLDGSTGYAPVGPIVVTVQAAATRDIEQEVLCDDQGGGTIVPFVRRYRYNPNGTFQGFLNLTLAGAPYVPLGTVIRCVDVAVIESDCADVEFLDLIDCTQTAFLRRIDHACDGTVTVVDTELDGTTLYVACDPVRFASEGALQSGAGGPAIVTRVTSLANYTTSVTTRRVTLIWTGNAASIGNRVALQINAGAFVALVNEAGLIIFGDLASPDQMGYTITIDVNQAADDVTVIEEF